MNRVLTLATGAGVGAAAMYVLDPDRGNRRRARIRDQLTHAANKTGDAIGATSRDMGHRIRGVVAEATSRFGNEPVSDETVHQRVRAELGRVVSHPSSIIATVHEGGVTLSGPILERELKSLLTRVRAVRGVRDVEDQLEVHETAGGVSGLQGGRPRTGNARGVLQRNWSPSTRVLVGAAGGALALYGVRREDTMGTALAVLGLSLVTPTSAALSVRPAAGVGARRRVVTVQDAININAPLQTVFAFWKDYQHFPHWMSHVRDVRETAPGRSHWVVDGPAGVSIEWDAVITNDVPNELLAWKSVPGSTFDHSGIIHFWLLADGRTHVDIKLSYNPPAGAIGHVVTGFFGSNPEQAMTDDLVRVKSTLETGNPPSDAAQPVERVVVSPDVTIQHGEAGPAAP